MSASQPRTVLIISLFLFNSITNGNCQTDSNEPGEKVWPTIECVDSSKACDTVNVGFESSFGKFNLTLTRTEIFSDVYAKVLKSPMYWNMSMEAKWNCYYHTMDKERKAFLSVCEGRVNGVVFKPGESFEIRYSYDGNVHSLFKSPNVSTDDSQPYERSGNVSTDGGQAREWIENVGSLTASPPGRLLQQPQGLLNVLFTVEPDVVRRLGRNGAMTAINQLMAIIIPAFRQANIIVTLSGTDFWPNQRVAATRDGQIFTRELHGYWATNHLPTGLHDVAYHLTYRIMVDTRIGRSVSGIYTVNSVCGRQAMSYYTLSNEGITNIAYPMIFALGHTLNAREQRQGQCGCNGCWLLRGLVNRGRGWTNCSLQAFADKIRSPEGDCLTRSGPPTTTTSRPLPPSPRPTTTTSTQRTTTRVDTTTTTSTTSEPITVSETEAPAPSEAGPNYLLFGLLGLLLLLLLLGLLIFVVVKKKKRDGQLRSRFDPSSSFAASSAMRSSYAGGNFAGSATGSQRSGLSRMSSGVGSSRNAMSQQSARSELSRASGAGSSFVGQRSRFSGVSNASAASTASRRSRLSKIGSRA